MQNICKTFAFVSGISNRLNLHLPEGVGVGVERYRKGGLGRIAGGGGGGEGEWRVKEGEGCDGEVIKKYEINHEMKTEQR